jgi:hypothetical protein
MMNPKFSRRFAGTTLKTGSTRLSGAKTGGHAGPGRFKPIGTRRWLRILAASLFTVSAVSVGFTAPAWADPAPLHTFKFSTTIDATDIGGAPDARLQVVYTFSPDLAPGSGPQGTSEGFAEYAPIHISFQIGDQCVATAATDNNVIDVYDGPTSFFQEDVYAFGSDTGGQLLYGYELLFGTVVLVDYDGQMFSSTALPLTTDFTPGVDSQQTTLFFRNPINHRLRELFAFDAWTLTEVLDPAVAIQRIKNKIDALGLNSGLTTELELPLNDAITKFNSGDADGGFKKLALFIKQVNALRGHGLSAATADALIAAANGVSTDTDPGC